MEKQLIPQLRFSEFSEGWKKNTIGKVSRIYGRIGYRGYTVQDIVKKGQGAITLSPSNFTNNHIDISKSTYISWDKYEESPEIKIYNRDILFVKTGSTFGKTAFVENLNEPATINPQIVVLKNITIHNEFLGYVITLPLIRKQVESIVVGGAIPTMSQKELSKMIFNLPPLPEQQKIASFLLSLDEVISKLAKKKELLELYKKGVMQKIFNQELRFKNDNGNEFPKWANRKLGQLSFCMDNKRIPINGFERNTKQGSIPYWGANGIVDYIDEYIFDETIVLLAEDGGYFDEFQSRPIANISYGKSWVNNHAHVIKAKEGLTTNEYLYYSLVHKNIMGYVNGGTRAKLNKSEMLQIKMTLPSSVKEQTKITDFLSNIDVKIDALNIKIENSKTFKKGLLQKMFV